MISTKKLRFTKLSRIESWIGALAMDQANHDKITEFELWKMTFTRSKIPLWHSALRVFLVAKNTQS
jgi:hypothetical protein